MEMDGANAGSANVASAARPSRRPTAACRFHGTAKGCRAGASCPFSHDGPIKSKHFRPSGRRDADALPGAAAAASGSSTQTADVVPEHSQESSSATTSIPLPVGARAQQQQRFIPKPISKAQQINPREFELQQLRRRYSPTETSTERGTVLTFKLAPSDPDFPFELDGLQCVLTVPSAYPEDGRPSLRVQNAEMERGYQINVEQGFGNLALQQPRLSLLKLMNELDKNLEVFLTSRKAQTLKLVANLDKAKTVTKTQPVGPTTKATPKTDPLLPIFDAQQRREAQARREQEVLQLESRLGRQPLFSKSANGQVFNIPVQIPKAGRLPLELQAMMQVCLTVPLLYPLEPCAIELKGVDHQAARNVEICFADYLRSQPHVSLMAKLNHLSQNMHLMARENAEKLATIGVATEEPILSDDAVLAVSEQQNRAMIDAEKPHIKIIPRPPEWDTPGRGSKSEDSSDSCTSDEGWSEESEDEDGGTQVPSQEQTSAPEKGIRLSFPGLELYGIELLELPSISVTIKCDRCKETTDINDIPSSATSQSTLRTESCRKCASTLNIVYRGELLHEHNIRAGFLDLEGASTVSDMLPSKFIPTCSGCSTAYTTTTIISVRGETSMTICRECHKKMTFSLPEVKFLRVSTELSGRPLPPRRKPKENLGISAGQELPKRGRCQHYGKSYRWFRFGCCGKVYPCDRCHDAAEEHVNEHANRMICGWCSREQAYRPEECGTCGRSVIGRKGGGFWEGGKGTRDKVRMSRKDPRKYKRRGAGGGGGKERENV